MSSHFSHAIIYTAEIRGWTAADPRPKACQNEGESGEFWAKPWENRQ